MPEWVDMLPLWLMALAFLLLAGACSSKISSILNVPVLLVFLGLGMVVGSDCLGLIHFSNAACGLVLLDNTLDLL